MGLAALRKILEPEPVELARFAGTTVAVDADNLLWSFVTAFGARGEQPVGPDGAPVGHFIGLTGRLKLYAQHDIRSVWVFDGPQPRLKEATLAGRAARIAETGSIELTREQITGAKALLTALGVPWMEAPCESDAQCAHFVRDGTAFAAITQDYDIALHGAPRAGRNLTGSKTRTPELLDLEASLMRAKLTRAQLVDAAILIGTDYNDGIAGVGPVKAVKLVQKHGDLGSALAALGATLPDAEEIRALFHEHPVDARARPVWVAPRAEAVGAILAQAGLGEKRGAEVCDALAPLHAR